jgi:hypothetical protein
VAAWWQQYKSANWRFDPIIVFRPEPGVTGIN